MSISSAALPPNFVRCLDRSEKKLHKFAGMTLTEQQEKLAAQEETELQRLIGELFALHGVIANRSRMDRKKTDIPGWPDYTMTLHGQGVAIEVKIPGRDLDPEQVKVRDRMLAPPNSWNYYVAHSVTEVIQILRAFNVIK